jgi:multicomponent Na+:H+ antiporter subunit E
MSTFRDGGMDRSSSREDKVSFITSFAVLFLFWILVSSKADLQHMIVGIGAALAVSHLSYDLMAKDTLRPPRLRTLQPILFFIATLLLEIIKANIEVAKIVLDPKLPIEPSIVKFKTKLKGDTAKVSLANSITLTPGTITMDIIGDTFYVHTLTREAAEDVTNWPIEDLLKEVEDAF